MKLCSMVSVSDIPFHIGQRFIDRKRLDFIEWRMSRVPPGVYVCETAVDGDEHIYLERDNGNCDLVLLVKRLGCAAFYTYAREDMEVLVEHVKAADEENDRLREAIRKLEAIVNDKRETEEHP